MPPRNRGFNENPITLPPGNTLPSEFPQFGLPPGTRPITPPGITSPVTPTTLDPFNPRDPNFDPNRDFDPDDPGRRDFDFDNEFKEPRPPGETVVEPGFDTSQFQVEIPDFLKRISEEGFGAGFLRDSFQLGGTPLAQQSNVASRGLREQTALQGVSGSGFAGDKIRQLELDKGKALDKLKLGIDSQNEATKRGALSQLKDIQLFNDQVRQDFENMTEVEKLNALMRQFQLESATKQFESQHQSTGQQLGNLGVTAGLGIAGIPGFGLAGAGIAGLGGLFSLFG